MADLVLHTCCGPCSTYTVAYWRGQGAGPLGFWYNPNIHPFTEHQRRLEALRLFARRVGLALEVSEGYDLVDFLRRVVGQEGEGERCRYCYWMRLERTAQFACQRGCRAFSTTLLLSPYQKHELLLEVGQAVGRQYGLEFCYRDLRGGFRESRRLSLELGLYRQKYCGCIYSEMERYAKVKVRGATAPWTRLPL